VQSWRSLTRVVGRGGEEPARFGDGDVEAAAAVEARPSWSDPAAAPVSCGALGDSDLGSELFVGDEPAVVPLGGYLDGFHT
jgi:hypothetical protein